MAVTTEQRRSLSPSFSKEPGVRTPRRGAAAGSSNKVIGRPISHLYLQILGQPRGRKNCDLDHVAMQATAVAKIIAHSIIHKANWY